MGVKLHSFLLRHAIEINGQLYVPNSFIGRLCEPQSQAGHFEEDAKSLASAEK
jgi:hypothetical protein